MKLKDYKDYWSDMESAHLLTRLTIAKFLVSFIDAKRETLLRDPANMSDEVFVKELYKFYNKQ